MPAASSQARSRSPTASTPRFVVAAGIDVHEIGQQANHRLMLPPEVLDDGGLRLDAH
jgi:hypothetical protein